MGIKYYLNQGFTLAVAYEKQNQRRGLFKCIKSFTNGRIQNIEAKDQHYEIDLGSLDNMPDKRVVAIVDNNGDTKLILRDAE